MSKIQPHLHQFLDHTIHLIKQIFSNFKISSTQLPQICTGALLIKACSKANTINLLLNNKLVEESEIILRVLIEVSFVVTAMQKNPDIAVKYSNGAFLQKRQVLRNLKRAVEEGAKFSTLQELEKEIEKLDKIIKEKGLQEIRIVEYAREAGQLVQYYSSYLQLCSSVHSGAGGLEGYFSHDSQKISSPIKNNAEFILFTAIETMLKLIQTAMAIFSIERQDLHSEIVEKLEEADKLYLGIQKLLREKYNSKS